MDSNPGVTLNLKFTKTDLLLVDDCEVNREHEIEILGRHGFNHIDEAVDGNEVIAMIIRKIIPYDLILCDMNTPTASGLEVLNTIRKEQRCARIPLPWRWRCRARE